MSTLAVRSHRNPRSWYKKILVVPSTIALSATVLAMLLLLYFTYFYSNIYPNIYIGDIYVGNLSKQQAEKLLATRYVNHLENLSVKVTVQNITKEVSYHDFITNFDIKKSVQQAYSIGRQGNGFNRISTVLNSLFSNKKNIKLEYNLNNNAIKNFVQDIYNEVYVDPKQPYYKIQPDSVLLYSGTDGRTLEADSTSNIISENLMNSYHNNAIDIPITTIPHNKIDVDDYYNKIAVSPKDASSFMQMGKVKFVQEQYGIHIDKETLGRAIEELNNSQDQVKKLNITRIEPKIKLSDLTNKYNAQIFEEATSNVIGSACSQFNTSNANNANRGVNIRIATSKINGTILQPGEIFSFNNTVGPRLTSLGYKVAHVYSGKQVVNGVGGGICQVTSTLYGAVLSAKLQVIERTAHSLPVYYVPNGKDATVSYNSVDFKFKNNSSNPIKINGIVTSDNKIVFKIINIS